MKFVIGDDDTGFCGKWKSVIAVLPIIINYTCRNVSISCVEKCIKNVTSHQTKGRKGRRLRKRYRYKII